MRAFIELNLKIGPEYKEMLMNYIHLLTIFLVVVFLQNDTTLSFPDIFIYIIVGQFVYDFTVKYFISL